MLDPFTTNSYWYAAIQQAGPLAFATLGALLCSRAGILFIGVEGTMLTGAFFSIAGTIWTGSILMGVAFGGVAGIACALLSGFLAMNLRMGDVIAGLVVQIGALGVTAFLQQQLFPSGQTIGELRLNPLWGSLGGGVADVVLHQNPLVYFAIAAAMGIQVFLTSRQGLRVRASGESVAAAQSFGIPLMRLRFAVLAVAGLLTGLGGAVIGLAVVGTFSVNITNGRGFIALACVMLGAWRPVAAVVAALVFAGADAYASQVTGTAIEGWVRVLPYVLTLIAIGAFWGRSAGPAEEGRGLPERA